MALQIHFFRVGKTHSIQGVIHTDTFPVSGLIITQDATQDVGYDVYARSHEMAAHILPLIRDAGKERDLKKDRYIKPAAAFTLDEQDRGPAGMLAYLTLPEPALAHSNPATTCQACAAALVAEYAYLSPKERARAIEVQLESIARYQTAYANLAHDPQAIGALQLRLNYEFHGLPEPSH